VISDMELRTDRVCLWLFDVERDQSACGPLLGELHPREQRRAEAFLQPVDRWAFVLGRGTLRRLLTRCLPPVGPIGALAEGRWGKPAVPVVPGEPPGLEFNISHSGGRVLLAATWGTAVGVDLEVPRPGVEIEELLRRFFSKEEFAVWQSLPAELRRTGFYHLWTRKEAVVKAVGRGLSLPLDSFQVTFDPRGACRVIVAPPETPSAFDWTLCDLTEEVRQRSSAEAPLAQAALALPGRGFELEWRAAEELLVPCPGAITPGQG
jgi:4'-phosphopantetheinyl transferase